MIAEQFISTAPHSDHWMHAEWFIPRLRKRVAWAATHDMVETQRQAHRVALDAETELRARWCR
jgi:hypothetical protein